MTVLGSNYVSVAVILDMHQPGPEARAFGKYGVVHFDLGLCGHVQVQSQDPAALRRVGEAFLTAALDLSRNQKAEEDTVSA